MVCVFDLTQSNEEEAVEVILRTNQPLDSCGYITQELLYGLTTVDSCLLINAGNESIIEGINVKREYDEFNMEYLIGANVDE